MSPEMQMEILQIPNMAGPDWKAVQKLQSEMAAAKRKAMQDMYKSRTQLAREGIHSIYRNV